MEKGASFYDYSPEKNAQLKQQRGISFDDVIYYIGSDALIDIIAHPNLQDYPGQEIYVLNIDNYIHLVPFKPQENGSVFLKTIFPSRKATKYYLGE